MIRRPPRYTLSPSSAASDVYKRQIIILDKNFNIIGETVFPEYTYNPNLMYIDEKGLYISENHYKNPNYDDDKLIFRLFRLCKSKEKYNDSAV